MPANTVLTGQLSLDPSDGPYGRREFSDPSFVRTCFDFEFEGRQMKHSGLLCGSHLWAPDGTQTTFVDSNFLPECGVIEDMMDSRQDWFYIRSDGTRHANRLKYTGCRFELMLKPTALHVRCRYYDQNPDITDYVTIYYSRDLDDVLLLKDIKYSYDRNGNVEDWLWGEGPYVTLVGPEAALNGCLGRQPANPKVKQVPPSARLAGQ